MPFVLPVIRTAGELAFTPVGDIAATDVQAAIAELDTEKVPYTGASGAVDLGAQDFTTTGTISGLKPATGAGDFAGIFGTDPSVLQIGTSDVAAYLGGYYTAGGNASTIYFGNNIYFHTGFWVAPEAGVKTSKMTLQAGRFFVSTAITASTVPPTRFLVNSDGNVGVGPDSSPDHLLDVQGTFHADGISSFDDKIIFTQTDGNEFIDSLNDGYMDYGATTAHRFNNDVVLPKTSGKGIKIDNATPTFGWRDLTGAIVIKTTGAGRPVFVTYKGNIEEYQFAINDKAEFTYHIPHDYVPGSDIHLHVHWSHISAAVTGGTITFGYELVYAKGHNQAPFGANKIGTIVATASATQYQHIVSEIQISAASPSGSQIDSDDLEPDGVILIELFLNANNMTGATPDPFVHEMDVHYQSTNIATKANVPDFYT